MPDLKLPVTVAPAVPGPTTHGVGQARQESDGTLVEGLSGVRLSCQIQAQDGMEVEIINRLGRPDPGSRPEDSIQPEPDWTSV